MRECSDPLLQEPPPEPFLLKQGSLEFIHPCEEKTRKESERERERFNFLA